MLIGSDQYEASKENYMQLEAEVLSDEKFKQGVINSVDYWFPNKPDCSRE